MVLASPEDRCFVYDGDGGELYVSRRCPHRDGPFSDCNRFIKRGDVSVRLLDGMPKFTGFICAKHGEVIPDYEYL